MNTTEYMTHSADETIGLGRELAATLRGLRMVILHMANPRPPPDRSCPPE